MNLRNTRNLSHMGTEEHLGDILASIEDANTVADLLICVRDYALTRGAKSTSYHMVPTLFSQTSEPVIVTSYGFDDEWLELYGDADFRQNDPLPDLVMAHGLPIMWQDALAIRQLNEKEQYYADMMDKYGLRKGLGIPLFGPNGRDAYSSISFYNEAAYADNMLITRIAALWQIAHVRIVNLLNRKRAKHIELSKREASVLALLAKGNSNAQISKELSISPSSVDTYMRRIFSKLDVNDRVGATVRAIGLGILKL